MRFHLEYAKFLDEIEGEYEQAQKHYKIVLETNKKDSSARLNYARLLHKMGCLKESKQEFELVFRTLKGENSNWSIRNQWIWPHFHYAKLLKDMQYYDSARKEFEVCIAIMMHHNNKFFSDIYYEYARLLFSAFNDNENAYYYVNIAIKAAPQKRHFTKLLYAIQDVFYKQKSEKISTETVNEEMIKIPTETENEEKVNEGTESKLAPINTGFEFGFGLGFNYETSKLATDQVDDFDANILNQNDECDIRDCGASIGEISLSGISNLLSSNPNT